MTRLGYQIPNFTYPDTAPGALFGAIARQAREAEASGFDTVLVMDHFFQLPMMGPPTHEMIECYTLLAGLARETTRVRLSALVTGNTYRNPAVLAKTVTALDLVSDGRAQLGIGAGWFELEHDAFGIPFGTFTDRFEKLEEALQIIIPMLRGEVADLDGRHYQARNAHNIPAPLSRIPVLIGGGGERKTLRMVATYADESNLICAPEEVGRKLEALDAHCADVGRDRSEITVSWQRSVCVAPTAEQAEAELHGYFAQVGWDLDALGEDHKAFILGRFILGDPDTVGERLAEDLARGVDGFTINCPVNGHIPERVALLGEVAGKVVGIA